MLARTACQHAQAHDAAEAHDAATLPRVSLRSLWRACVCVRTRTHVHGDPPPTVRPDSALTPL
jgi:hypothetical protein